MIPRTPGDFFTFVSIQTKTGKNMSVDLRYVISFVIEDETPESPYQSVIPNIKTFKKDNPDNAKADIDTKYQRLINEVLERDFYIALNNRKATEINKYLDYHYIKFNEKRREESIDFLYSVIEFMSQSFINIHIANQKFIDIWIEEKRKGIKADVKEPKIREYISHPQQILLFEKLGIVKYLKDKYKLNPGTLAKIISLLSNRGLNNTDEYLRYVSLPKEKIPQSKKNYDPKTPENIEFLSQTLIKLGLSE